MGESGSRPIKVLQTIARMNMGGTAQYVNQLISGLNEEDFHSMLVTGSVQKPEIEAPINDGVPCTRISELGRKISPFNDVVARNKLRTIVGGFNPDIVHSHTFKAGVLSRSLKHDRVFIHTFHGHLLTDMDLQGLRKAGIIALEKRLAKRSDKIVTVGEKVARDLLEVGIGRPEQYVSIPPGVEPLPHVDRDVAASILGISPDGGPYVVTVARVTGVKRPDRIVQLAREMPDTQFLLAGGGDLADWVSANAPRNLNFLGWQEAKYMWAVADVVLSPSDNEGMPVSLIEAQLAGLPVVATDVGSVGEVVIHAKTGLLTPTCISEIKIALITMLGDSRLRAELANAASMTAHQRFSVKQNIQNHTKLYLDLL